MSTRKKKALGRGLGALLGNSGGAASATTAESSDPSPVSADKSESAKSQSTQSPNQSPTDQSTADQSVMNIELIEPNPDQPRRSFDEDKLQELADSISEHGVLQPLLITKNKEGAESPWLLLAGERRWRASRRVGLKEVPVRIIEATEQQQLEFALIENIQRDDLNPVEEARGFEELVSKFGYTQDQVAKSVGKSRVAIANALRLLKLSDYTLQDLENGTLTPGHARALLMLHHPLQREELRQEIVDQGMTVREAESRAREYLEGKVSSGEGLDQKSSKKPTNSSEQNLDVQQVQEKIMEVLGCPVRLKTRNGKKGKLEVSFQNLDDFDRILDRLGIDRNEL